LAPDQPETWINLVRHLISVGEHQSAKTEMDNAAKKLPDERKHVTLAQCCELFGSLRDASDHYETARKHPSATVRTYRAAADFHLRAGSYPAAEALYRSIFEQKIAGSGDDVNAARHGLALALVKQNRPRKATEALQLVGLTLDDKGMLPDGKIAEEIDEQRIQAKVLGSLNHHKLRLKAIAILESLQLKNALPANDQFLLARLLAQQMPDSVAWVKTRNLLKALTLQYPKNWRYLSYAAQLHIQQKEFNDAEPILTRLEAVERERKTMPGTFGSVELRAKILEMRGLDSQATALLTAYAEQPGASPQRKLLLAQTHGRLGNYREAVDLCEQVHEIPEFAIEANTAVVTMLRTNKPSEALLTKHTQWQQQQVRVETMLRDAIRKNPKDVSSRLHLADLMELQGKYNEVETLCRDVLKEQDTNLVALNNLAWLLGQKANQAAEALALVQRAIDSYGLRPELLGTRAIVLLNKGDYEPALRDLERLVNEAPTPTRLFHLSRAHERARNTTAALAMLRQANEQGLTVQQLHPVEQAEYQRVTAELGKRQ
jgi:tetratricopeptide (TPR) repeat protein